MLRSSLIQLVLFFLLFGFLAGCANGPNVKSNIGSASSNGFILEDAERFVTLYEDTGGKPSAADLQTRYIDSGTVGIAIFMKGRIESAEHLAKAIALKPLAYQKAVDICFPAARNWAPRANTIMKNVAAFIGADKIAPAFAVFGALNSGGNADARGLSLGLEVLCRFVSNKKDAMKLYEDFTAHEITHVYQARAGQSTVESDNTLLQAALQEGFADFVAEYILGRVSAANVDRTQYGLAHEAALWKEFKTDVDSGASIGTWMYAGPTKERPADLGYWIGKRICEAYYAKADDKKAAIKTLLERKDPAAILAASGYGDNF